MKERVSVRLGTAPVLVVAPHGHHLDDGNTDWLAESLADHLDAHAVVNRGWRRATAVDEVAGLANCNDIRHCREPVVDQEFLAPINSVINDANMAGEQLLVLMIHGMGNQIRQQAGDGKLAVVVGWGNGKPPRPTCETWKKNAVVDLLNDSGVKTYEGAAGGPFSARGSNNLTQVLRQHNTDVLQLEVVYAYRSTRKEAEYIGSVIGTVVETILQASDYHRPAGTLVREI